VFGLLGGAIYREPGSHLQERTLRVIDMHAQICQEMFKNCPKIVQKLSNNGLKKLEKSWQKVGKKLFKVVKK
jgi:hypothetical protein